MRQTNVTKAIFSFLFLSLLFLEGQSQIWVTHLTYGRPFTTTYYLGDKINASGAWNYQFEIGQSSWNASQVGVGQNTDGSTGWNWADASYYQDGSFPNKKVQRDISNVQFTNTGVWYVVGRARANSGDAWTYTEEAGWNNNTSLTLSTTTGNASYFNVNALSSPTTQTAGALSASSISLSWAKWNSRNVMVVRSTSNSFTTPTNGTAYTNGASIGSGTVVYNGSATSFTDNSLSASTTYYYAFYSENYAYYSTAVTASATTQAPAPAGPTLSASGGVVASTPGSGTSGYVGSTITLNGTNLDNVTTVKVGGVNGTAVTIVSQTSTSITFTAINAGGQIYVANAGGSATSTETYTNLGYISNAEGDWNTNGTWLNGAVPPSSSTVTVAHDLTLNGVVANAPNSVNINSGKTLSFGTTGTITISTLTINGTVNMTSGGILTIAAAGIFTNNGTFSRGSGTVNFAGAGTVNGSVATIFNNLTINTGGLTLTTIPTVDSVFRINGGFVATNAPRYSTNSTLFYNSPYNRSNEWNATGIGAIGTTSGYPNNVTINTGTFSLLNADAGTARAMAGNLTVSSGATFTTGGLNALVTVGGNITINGTLTMSTSTSRIKCANFTNNSGAITTLSSSVGGDLELTGSLIDNGTFNANTRAVFFTGNSLQDVSGSGTFNIDYIVMNKPSGRVRMLNNLLCEGPNGGNALSFSSSTDTLDLNGYAFTLGKVGLGSGISGNGILRGGTTSSISLLGTGTLGTLRFDQSTPGVTDALSAFTVDRTGSGSVTLGSNITIGALTLTNGALSAGNNIINISGNITRSSGQLNAASGTVAFINSNSVNLPSNLFSGNVNNMTINGVGGVGLGSDMTLNGTLTLTNGLLTLGANHLTLGSSSNVSGIPSASNMIVATGTGTLRKVFSGAGNFTFPIGDNTGTTEYSPVNVNLTSGTFGSGAYVSAKVTNSKHPNDASSNNFINRYWTLGQSGINSFSAIVTGNYVVSDVNGSESDITMGYWSGALPWIRYAASVNTAAKTITSGALNTLGDFAGIMGNSPIISIITSSEFVCPGGSVTLQANVTGAGEFTYVWSPGGATASSITVNPSSNTTYSVLVADANGQSNSISKTIQIIQPVVTDIYASACNSYQWNGSTYLLSGNYTSILTASSGCDSLAILHLTINGTTSGDTTAFASDQFVWYGTTYTSSGDYAFTLLGGNSNGCDSVVFLHLTITTATYGDVYDTACDSYTWYDQSYTASGNYIYIMYNANSMGEDSIITLHLTINNSKTSTVNISSCGNYILPWGDTATTSGSYSRLFTGSNGCDSTSIIQVTIQSGSISSTSVSACNTYEWNGNTYTQSGVYTRNYNNANGCASIDTLYLTINTGSGIREVVSACGSYVWRGLTFTTSGIRTYNYTNGYGCASVDTLELTINASSSSVTNITTCGNALPYSWNNNSYNAAGTYTVTLTNAAGCDSLAVLVLTTTNGIDWGNVQWPPNGTICEGGTFTVYGKVYEGGQTEAAGPASGITAELGYSTSNTNPSTWSNWIPATFNVQNGNDDEYMATLSGLAPGTYYYAYRYKINGCNYDYFGYGGGAWNGTSSVSGVLTVNGGTRTATSASACGSYVWNGTTYTQSGTYVRNYNNANGCPSADTLYLTINTGTTITESATACNSYVWNGATYTVSGTYTRAFTNANGCASDSVLNLTINATTYGSTTVFSGDAYLWYGNTYSSSGSYTHTIVGGNASGCDSIVVLNLIITTATYGDTTAVACDSYSWKGTTYTQSGNYTYIMQGGNWMGQDSIITLHLTINNSKTTTLSGTGCGSYTLPWNDVVTVTGTYTRTYTAENGCDSTVVVNVTIDAGSYQSQTVSACNSYEWFGTTYTESGVYTRSYNNANGCASVDTLNLTINKSSGAKQTATSCNSYVWNGVTYTTSGTYTYNYTNGYGCASVDTLELTINASSSSVTNITTCGNALPYSWNNNSYNAAGTYTVTLTNAAGCDSLAVLVLTTTNGIDWGNVQWPPNGTICEGGTFTVYGKVYEGGQTEAAGPASGITAELGYSTSNTNPSTWSNWIPATFNVQNGNDDEYMATLSGLAPGTYYYAYRYKINGCNYDYFGYGGGAWNGTSSVSGVLTVNGGTRTATSASACGSYVWNGTTYTQSGTYVRNYNNANGCPSADTLYLTINQGSVHIDSVSVCNTSLPYVWQGNSYTQSGIYTVQLQGVNGCDSTHILQINIVNCSVTLQLKAYLEGYYMGSGTMKSTLYDLSISTDPTATDSIEINLWSPDSLLNANPTYSQKGIVHTNGLISISLPGSLLGDNYYLAIKHRSSIETWSSSPVLITSNTQYDFTANINMAFGDGFNAPMKQVGTNMYAIYGGDVNQDGGVDLIDLTNTENDASQFAFGYNSSDINGDGSSDLLDLSIIENNASQFIFYARPY